MTDANGFIEVQGTAEDGAFDQEQFSQMLALAKEGIETLVQKQKAVLGL